ncbi:hypothetical protein [Flexithrix dorotheae]|uniref:hypothetical protein n=1 Tax=Flexithrix dorotheae TaxID=70993 RepID=UPI00037C7A39|nr:hypothetical protein [Flexithrix dorotheae]
MITLITGKRSSGKTRKAKELTKEKETVWLSEDLLISPFSYYMINSKTEFIVIDDLKNKEAVLMLLSSEKIRIERRGKDAELIKTPNIIIISETLDENDFLKMDLNIIKCII